MVTRTAFGALPIQRLDLQEATRILRRAYDGGINFFDTARGYSDSEEKMGHALNDVRDRIIIATKSGARTRDKLLADLEASLRNLRTDYVDILQLHNPGQLPDPDDPQSSYAGLLAAKEQGMVRFLGLSNHRVDTAAAAVASGLYDTLQFPLSSISSDRELELIAACREHDVGLIAMKALSGGLITNARAAFAFLRQYENVVPIWGIQRLSELEEFLALEADPPDLNQAVWAEIKKDRDELTGDFCRACGYCQPCAAGIPIPMAARMSLVVRRMPYQGFLSDEWRGKMKLIEECRECGRCRERCPYGLDIPVLLKRMLAEYEQFYQAHAG